MPEGLSALSMQVGMAIEHIRTVDRDVGKLRKEQQDHAQRLAALERGKERSRLASLMREVATPREWATALVIALLALWGIVTPEEARDKVRSVLSLPPLNQRGPG